VDLASFPAELSSSMTPLFSRTTKLQLMRLFTKSELKMRRMLLQSKACRATTAKMKKERMEERSTRNSSSRRKLKKSQTLTD